VTVLARLDVIGVPKPQGSKIAFVNKATGKAGMKEQGERGQRAWRSAVAQVARDAAHDAAPFDGPLGLNVVFRMPCPKARLKKAPCWHVVTPDLSKLLRATEDGLVDGGLILDDRLIAVGLVQAIEVVGWTGARIEVRQLEDWQLRLACAEAGIEAAS
jgi:Holliday junction resolvase RusA-like endonuclease